MVEQVIAQIKPLDLAAMAKCQIRLDNLTKPLGSLHAFEHLACKMAGITRQPRPQRTPPVLVLMNGSRRTGGMIDVFASQVSARIICFDVATSTKPMTRQIRQTMEQGIKIACAAAAGGAQVIGVGVVEETDAGVLDKIVEQVRSGVAATVILNAVDSLEVAGLVGIILGAASAGAAIVLDGAVTSAAALLACTLAPLVCERLIGSHFSAEPQQAEILEMTSLPAYLYLGMNVGEGVGAVLGISLIHAALHVLNDMKTFGEAEVSVAEDGPGALVQDRNVRD
jgi:nicotinate-nucleotide--dimethylbenzimidazole phosphoribosyltransferase